MPAFCPALLHCGCALTVAPRRCTVLASNMPSTAGKAGIHLTSVHEKSPSGALAACAGSVQNAAVMLIVR